jgi:hypothetical protein
VCLGFANQFSSEINRSFNELRGGIVKASSAPSAQAYSGLESEFLSSQYRQVSEVFSAALRACRRSISIDQNELPERKAFGASLGVIGQWAGWLLQSEAMPVVIVVGLVGFSLLGATVSRVVRQSLEGPGTQLTLDDLLFVIAGGITSAFVVFLAAYGGLAIVGSGGTNSDPNPYVVFVTCLVAAVYSELVWRWAQRKILAPLDGENGNAQVRAEKTPSNVVPRPPGG